MLTYFLGFGAIAEVVRDCTVSARCSLMGGHRLRHDVDLFFISYVMKFVSTRVLQIS